MKIKLLLLTLFLFFSVTLIKAQDVILDENPEENYSNEKKFGPNEKHFFHSVFKLGFAANQSEGTGADIMFGASHSINYGFRYKFKIAEFLALVTEISYNYTVFHIKQETGKIIPDAVLHKNENFKLNSADLGAFLRFNFGKRGNIIGKYLDLGAYGTYTFSASREYNDEFTPVYSYLSHENTKTVEKNLNYFSDYNYGPFARIGFEHIALFGKYRMSDIFTPEFKTGVSATELPRLEIGIEFSMYEKN